MRGVSISDGLPRLRALGLVFDAECLPAAHEYWGVWIRNLTVIRVGTSPIDVPVEVASLIIASILETSRHTYLQAKEEGLHAATAGEDCVSYAGDGSDSVGMFVERSLVASFSAVLA
ncbi:hypothetical protein PAXINDRAFT_17387 [Paxillus involutus ATCC 200175]|uniref:Uncharacterized protein n=1 Tax=Paxillus involutus ATCC 200175 TaxID=664439 RepID=A0A0C9SQA8_PAXIN|nr:hypothetical protein PAXINDRAFT_17387 [Paxillus involutus ATCC 200175]